MDELKMRCLKCHGFFTEDEFVYHEGYILCLECFNLIAGAPK